MYTQSKPFFLLYIVMQYIINTYIDYSIEIIAQNNHSRNRSGYLQVRHRLRLHTTKDFRILSGLVVKHRDKPD